MELSKIAEYASQIKDYGGTLLYNQVPEGIKQNGKFYIILTIEPNEQHGSGHYVCVDLRPSNFVYYFDPYSKNPDWIRRLYKDAVGKDNTRITDFLNNLGKPIRKNKVPYQIMHNNIDDCADWCLVFAKYPVYQYPPLWKYLSKKPYGDAIVQTIVKNF